MQVTVKEIRSGRVRKMDKRVADFLVKMKKATYDGVEPPQEIPVYKPAVVELPVKEKKPRKKKEYQTKIMKPE